MREHGARVEVAGSDGGEDAQEGGEAEGAAELVGDVEAAGVGIGTLYRHFPTMDVRRLVSGITMVPTADPEQKQHLLDLALDGSRYRATG